MYIARYGIALNRGTYGVRKDSKLPSSLITKIGDYIDGSPNNTILAGAVYSEFEKDFVANGIDNPYYMIGVLREALDKKYLFRKGYIFKGGDITSIYREILDFVLRSPAPVSKREIQKRFPGVTDIIIQTAIIDDRILNYFGEYYNADKLEITNSEIKGFHETIECVLGDGQAHHINDVFSQFQNKYSSTLDRNGITFAFRLFSVLEYLFGDEYQFSRPYIAESGVAIGRAGERLKELVINSDEISVSEITSFAKANHFTIYSILEFINSLNETHLLKDKSTLVAISELDLDDSIITEIENRILDEIGDNTVLIANLSCIHYFRSVSVPWNEWLIYSILLKWSNRLEVGVTDAQFKRATPIVARRGHLDTEEFRDIDDLNKVYFAQADNLDNIDDLISDYILDGDA